MHWVGKPEVAHLGMAVACGGSYTLLVSERGGDVFACGSGSYGQLGAGTREHQRMPAPVAGLEGLPDVVMVAAGYEHSAAMTSAGALLLWGWSSGAPFLHFSVFPFLHLNGKMGKLRNLTADEIVAQMFALDLINQSRYWVLVLPRNLGGPRAFPAD